MVKRKESEGESNGSMKGGLNKGQKALLLLESPNRQTSEIQPWQVTK
jgi:hypothetical protein